MFTRKTAFEDLPTVHRSELFTPAPQRGNRTPEELERARQQHEQALRDIGWEQQQQ